VVVRSKAEDYPAQETAGQGRPGLVVRFLGSEDFGRDSDADLLLVVQTEQPFLERARGYFDVMDFALEMDLLVYTPEEFSSLTDKPSPGFRASVVASMKRVVWKICCQLDGTTKQWYIL
jgi:hypothetical protein